MRQNLIAIIFLTQLQNYADILKCEMHSLFPKTDVGWIHSVILCLGNLFVRGQRITLSVQIPLANLSEQHASYLLTF